MSKRIRNDLLTDVEQLCTWVRQMAGMMAREGKADRGGSSCTVCALHQGMLVFAHFLTVYLLLYFYQSKSKFSTLYLAGQLG